jgi:phage gpG-like protein
MKPIELQQKVAAFKVDLKRTLKAAAQKAPLLFHAYVEQFFDEGGEQSLESITWSRSQFLAARSGRLTRSFIPNQRDSIFQVDVSDDRLRIRLGTAVPYAAVHEGPAGSSVFIASRGRMHKYFWAQYAKSKNPFFKVMALSVQKRGGVTIPKRPFFANAVARFQAEGLPRLLEDVFSAFRLAFK